MLFIGFNCFIMKNTEITKVREPLILLLSKTEFSLIERRIYWIILSQMEQGFNVSPDLFQNREFKISISDLKETNRQRIKDTVKKITTRQITNTDLVKDTFECLVPFPYAKYDGKNGCIDILMLANVIPYFLELKKGFSEFEIVAALSLTSEYSQKLYPLLCRWRDTGKWLNVDINTLKELLDANHYEYFGNFKQRVLDVGYKEINEKTNIRYEMVFHKTGRNVTTVDFLISQADKIESIEANKAVNEEMQEVAKLNIGQIMAQASKILSTYNFSANQYKAIMTDNSMLQIFIQEDSKIVHGVRKNVKNKTAYMATILGFSKKK